MVGTDILAPVTPRTETPSSSDLSEKAEKFVKRCTWTKTESKLLIAAYKESYDKLRSTRSSHIKKQVWESILSDFSSMCSDAGFESNKTLSQIKEKWRTIFEKYNVVDHNNKTGNDPKTFHFT